MSRYQFPQQPIANNTLLGNNTGSTALPVELQPDDVRNLLEILSQAETQAIIDGKLSLTGGTLTGKLAFSGTSHAGLQLNSLTTVEYGLLTPASGDLFRDSTTDRIDARLARGTVELIDTAGGQTINGAFNVTGVVQIGASGPRIVPNIGGSGRFQVTRGDGTGDFYVGEGGTGGTTVRYLGAVTSGAPGTSAPTCYLSPQSAGVWQMGTTTNNALGSLNLTNLTASGTVTISDANGSLQIFNSAMVLRRGGGSSLLLENGNAGHPLDLSASGPVNIVSAQGIPACLGFSNTRANLTPSVRISQESAGVLQIGTTANNALGSLLLNNLTASGTLRVGGGTVVANILSATATLDFPSIATNDTHTLTITVTGAVAGDSVFLGVPAGLEAGLIFCASVTAADTVTVRMHNSSGGSIDPASGTFRATVIRF